MPRVNVLQGVIVRIGEVALKAVTGAMLKREGGGSFGCAARTLERSDGGRRP
jgi:hypothetical protein